MLEKFQNLIIVLIVAIVVAGSWLWSAGAYGVGKWLPVLTFLSVPLMIYAITQGAIYKRSGWWFVGCLAFLLIALIAGYFLPQYITYENALGNPVLRRVQDTSQVSDLRPISFEKDQSLMETGILCGAMAMGALVMWFLDRRCIRHILHLLFLNGVILCLLGWAIWKTGKDKILGLFGTSQDDFFSGYAEPGQWAAFATLCAGIGLGLLEYNVRRFHLKRPSNPWVILLVFSVLLLAVIPIGAPQMGWVGVSILGLALIIFGFRKVISECKKEANWKVFALAWVMGILTAGAVGMGAWKTWEIQKKQTLGEVWESLGGETMPEWWIRKSLWRDTIEMGKSRSYWGWGLGSYREVFSENFAGKEFHQQKLPTHHGYAEIVSVGNRFVRFRPLYKAFPQSDEAPRTMEYSIQYSRPLKFEWNQEFEMFRQRSTEVTFTTYLDQIILDERTVSVFLDEDVDVLRLDDPDIPNLINWNFEYLKEHEGNVLKENVGWNWELYDRNTIEVSDFASGKSEVAGDGIQTKVSLMRSGGILDGIPDSMIPERQFARIQVGKFDTNSIWANYLNGPYFRLISEKARLKDNHFYTFLIHARRQAKIADPEDLPALSLEMGPEEQNKFQEYTIAQPDTEWRSYFISVPYWDYKDGNFAIRRSTQSGKAAGAVIDIDNVEVFQHKNSAGIGVSAAGIGTNRVRLNFFYQGVYHPVEIRADKTPEQAKVKPGLPFAYNDYLEFWVELGWLGLIACFAPLFGLIYRVFHAGESCSISRWIFLSCGAVAIQSILDSPLQHPGVLWMFVICLTLAAKYNLILGKEKREKARKRR